MNILKNLGHIAQNVRAFLSRGLGGQSNFSRLVRRHRRIFSMLLCGGVALLSFFCAFVIRFEFSSLDGTSVPWINWFVKTSGLVLLVRLTFFQIFNLHKATWRYAGTPDVFPVFASVLISSIFLVPAVLFVWDGFFPRSILAIDTMLCFLLLGAARFSFRILDDLMVGIGASHQEKVLVVGAGAAGNLTVRAMLTRGLVEYWPVGLVDDDPHKKGTTIQGVPVYGPIKNIVDVAQKTKAQAIVLALPTANSSDFYKAIGHCKKTGLPLKTTPDLNQILRSSNVVTRVTDFRLEDLLHRRPIRSDVPEIQEFLLSRRVLVTGAAGSIGSELCRQIVEQGTERLICVDKDENGLFRLEHELKHICGDTDLTFFLGDIKSELRMGEVFENYRPEVVFHAAAYKHVPVLQHHPTEAILNNVGGTRNIAELANQHGVSHFVLISTDKAVNPTSVMGATKRIAERVVRSCNQRSATKFNIIRFGNVLGSAGSVVELWLKQIRNGHPVTVTHPDIERFFMTIPEAVHLVLYSATMGAGGDTFILDMGKPMKIAKLARQMISLSGLTPDVDVNIEYTGLRPGEKLYEELWTDQEKPKTTSHPGILIAPGEDSLSTELSGEIPILLNAANQNDRNACWEGLLTLVPTFQGRTNGEAHLPPDQASESTAS
ncbi:MAG: polysaccharide biosynthesis protein [bacterium]|nr:polysaccharide biosynthesis protein [bacterium]